MIQWGSGAGIALAVLGGSVLASCNELKRNRNRCVCAPIGTMTWATCTAVGLNLDSSSWWEEEIRAADIALGTDVLLPACPAPRSVGSSQFWPQSRVQWRSGDDCGVTDPSSTYLPNMRRHSHFYVCETVGVFDGV